MKGSILGNLRRDKVLDKMHKRREGGVTGRSGSGKS